MSGTGKNKSKEDPCPVLHKGARFTLRAVRSANGDVPAQTFIEGLDKSDKAKIVSLLEYTAENGPPNNREKFKKVVNGIFEFKSHQLRIGCFYGPGQIFLTHGFRKKQDNWPDEQVDRARALKKHHEDNHG